MSTMTKPMMHGFSLPHLRLPRLNWQRRRRQTTIDLIHSSDYLKRDIGLLEEHVTRRQR